ncbi:hypothetical protein [Streptomyces sp. NPDC058486]|uniref:hypothetical protein n=1 Tax=unclassified Streptomyces TaxID=2593676 RepID=UPI00365B5CED
MATSSEEARRVRGELDGLDGLIALVESRFTYEEKNLRAALNGLSVPLSEDFALRDLTGRWPARPSPTPAPGTLRPSREDVP